MRLEETCCDEFVVLFENEGREGCGEPDLGCDTQSSERESNQACSMSIML
jgi:hypothetical protein